MIRRKCRIPECQDEIGTMQLHHYRCGQVMANAAVSSHTSALAAIWSRNDQRI